MLGKEKKKKIHQIVELALDVSQGKPDVFVNYSPHTQQLDVLIYEQGWSKRADYNQNTTLYLKGCLSAELNDFNKVIRQLKRLKVKEVQ